MNALLIVPLCITYAMMSVTGAALIKMEATSHSLGSAREYIAFLITPRAVGGFAIIALAALFLVKALSMGDFSYVIPVAVGMHFALAVLIGILFFGDAIPPAAALGLSLIFIGIALLSLVNLH